MKKDKIFCNYCMHKVTDHHCDIGQIQSIDPIKGYGIEYKNWCLNKNKNCDCADFELPGIVKRLLMFVCGNI